MIGRRPGRRLVAAVALVAGAGLAADAAPLAVRDGLPNGIRLLVAERTALPIVVLQVSVPAGSAADPPEAGGLANLTAELLTRGTARRTGPELDRAIEFVGGSLEASAGRDSAVVSLSVLKRDLDLGLDLLAEVLTEPAFPEAELRRKVVDIQAEITRSNENPETVGSRALAKLVFPGHPYGRPTVGTVESVGKLDREQVVRFHQRYYRPDRAIVVAAGDVSLADVRAALARRLGSWAAPAEAVPPVPPAPASPPVTTETLTRDLTQATIFLGRPGVRQIHPDYFPLIVANHVLGGGSASRLYAKVRDERGLVYSVYSYLSPGLAGAAYSVGLQTRIEAVPEALTVTREEMARMGRDGVTAAELDLAQSYLIGGLPLRLDTTSKVAGLILAIEEQGLGLDYLDRFARQVKAVTAADVQRVARMYMDPATFSTVVVTRSP